MVSTELKDCCIEVHVDECVNVKFTKLCNCDYCSIVVCLCLLLNVHEHTCEARQFKSDLRNLTLVTVRNTEV